jgi:methionyl-tRNA formyltransferase
MSNNLRIVFMGTPDFAVASLDALVKGGCNIVGVITSPDRPAGRGQKIRQSAVKQYAVENDLNVLQPTNLKAPEFIEELQKLNVDLQVVVAFRMLPEMVWDMPEYGTINLHASLLPQYRGAAPINWAIINGEKESGVTTFFIQKEIDTGDIIMNETVAITENDTAGDLHDKLMNTGAGLLLKTVQQIALKETSPKPQQFSDELKMAPKIFKPDCKIDWQAPISDVYNKVRGLSPYPAAWTELKAPDGKLYSTKLFDTSKTTAKGEPGTIDTDNKTYLQANCKDGALLITELQIAGKKRMTIEDFLRGFNIDNSWTLN